MKRRPSVTQQWLWSTVLFDSWAGGRECTGLADHHRTLRSLHRANQVSSSAHGRMAGVFCFLLGTADYEPVQNRDFQGVLHKGLILHSHFLGEML